MATTAYVVAVTRSNDPEIHRAGCADVKRGLSSGKYQDAHPIESDSPESLALDWWDDILDEYEEDRVARAEYDAVHHWTKILPCTR